jgi:hypothetical protein
VGQFLLQSFSIWRHSVANSDANSLFEQSAFLMLGSGSVTWGCGGCITASDLGCCAGVWGLESYRFTNWVGGSVLEASTLLAWSLLMQAWCGFIEIVSMWTLVVNRLRISGEVFGCSNGIRVVSRHRHMGSFLGCWDIGGCGGITICDWTCLLRW